MFVIADGEPSADGYRGIHAQEDTRRAVKEVSLKNFDILQITIDSSLDPSKMFTNFIKLTDLSRLANDLGRIIKTKVMKNTRSHIS